MEVAVSVGVAVLVLRRVGAATAVSVACGGSAVADSVGKIAARVAPSMMTVGVRVASSLVGLGVAGGLVSVAWATSTVAVVVPRRANRLPFW